MAKHSHLPKYNEFLNPLFQALHDQIAVNSGPDRFSTIFIHYARFDTQRPFGSNEMAVIVPEKEDQALIHHRLFSEIELGIIKDSTRAELLSIIKKMIDRHSIDAVILDCTELPLINPG
ncbi:MAG: hypothetical protein K9N21_11660 [Deltaproteobacteria bacterium]|nr:hypothetical protein [Deltaproteobacteria bacterium]